MPMKIFLLSSLLLLLALQLSCAPRYYRGPVSDHFDGSRFYNPGSPLNKGLVEFLKWQWTRQPQPWPGYSELPSTDTPPLRVTGNQLRVSLVGHVTVLIQTQGLNILTDPVWSDRASPLTWIGPRRVHPPGIRFADLPPIDLVLISHNHYDHLDLATIERLWRRDHPRIIVPLGNDTLIHDRLPEAGVEAHDWGEQVRVTAELTIHLEPMHHWSARSPFDRNRALWAAFVLASPSGNIVFVGDSGYGDGATFRRMGQKFEKFRLALLPIGSYDPRWFMAYGHMNPAEAVRAAQDLGQPPTLPLHYGTFPLADTGYQTPLRDLETALAAAGVSAEGFRPLKAGAHWWVP